MTLQMSHMIMRSEQHLSCDLDSQLTILDLKSSSYFGLNSVGTFVWEELDRPKSIQALKCALLENFDVDEQTCEAELLQFLNALLEVELISKISR